MSKSIEIPTAQKKNGGYFPTGGGYRDRDGFFVHMLFARMVEDKALSVYYATMYIMVGGWKIKVRMCSLQKYTMTETLSLRDRALNTTGSLLDLPPVPYH